MSRPIVLLTTACILLGALPSPAVDLDDQLDKQLRGAWAVLEVEVYSSCSTTYSDNKVGAAGVASKADRRFSPGELVKIDKIKVKRARIDLLISLEVPVLMTTRNGPFELFDERDCKAQLIFEVPREVIKTRNIDAVLTVISSALTTSSKKKTAMKSDNWNGREREPYPDNYEQTLARYEQWKAEQINIAVTAGIDRSIAEAADVADDIESDADYLDGFAAGAEKMQEIRLSDCTQIIDASFTSSKKNPPSDKNSAWKRGFEDGQSLVFHLRRARKLKDCFVPVPAALLP